MATQQLALRKTLGLPDAEEIRAQLRADLALAGERLIGQIRLDSMTLAELRERIVVDPTQEGLKTALGAVERKQSASLDTLRPLIALLEALDMDSAEYRALLAQQSGLLGTEILDGAVFANLLRERVDVLRDILIVDAPGFIIRILAFILVLLLSWLVAKVFRALPVLSLVWHCRNRSATSRPAG